VLELFYSLSDFGCGINELTITVNIDPTNNTANVIKERQKKSLVSTTFHIAKIEIVIPPTMHTKQTVKQIVFIIFIPFPLVS